MTDQIHFAPPEGDAPAGAVTPAAVATTPVVPVVVPKKRAAGLTNVLFAVAALVAVGGLAFAVGRATAPVTTARGAGARTATGFPAGGPAGSFDPAARGGFAGGDRTVTLTGTVKSADGSTLVITAADGTERTIDVSTSTYHAQARRDRRRCHGRRHGQRVRQRLRRVPARRGSGLERRTRGERCAGCRQRHHHGHRRDDHGRQVDDAGAPSAVPGRRRHPASA